MDKANCEIKRKDPKLYWSLVDSGYIGWEFYVLEARGLV